MNTLFTDPIFSTPNFVSFQPWQNSPNWQMALLKWHEEQRKPDCKFGNENDVLEKFHFQ